VVRRHPLYIVDAFARRPFEGNPAAVCLPRVPLSESVQQSVAAEMNLPETAFVSAPDGDLFATDSADLRWFTPRREVPLCGHATLAAAAVLFDELGVDADRLTFRTASGPLRARQTPRGIEVELPALAPAPTPVPPGLERLLGPASIEEAGLVADRGYLVVRYPAPEEVRRLAPDFAGLRREFPDLHLVMATARGDAAVPVVSRCFAPSDGIDEDPVTGAAHAVLGPYWAPILGRTSFDAEQASTRGGRLHVELAGPDRVRLEGRARIVLRGYIDLPE
jgi:predicted PhzF superfamily epimerase YddE/YHI9